MTGSTARRDNGPETGEGRGPARVRRGAREGGVAEPGALGVMPPETASSPSRGDWAADCFRLGVREGEQLCAPVDAKLLVDVPQVGFHRVDGQVQLRGNLPVGLPGPG